MTLDEFRALPPEERRYAVGSHEQAAWLADLTPEELDEAGQLLCHASPTSSRRGAPIIGDLPTIERKAQERLENKVFGYEQPLDEESQ